MNERCVFSVAPGNADPMEISATFIGNLVTYEPCVHRQCNYRRLPRKLKKRLRAYIRSIEERELAMVEAWWSRWRAK